MLGVHERSSGVIGHASSTTEFQNFISDKELFDIEGVGNRFTWATHCNAGYIVAHLDRALASHDFLNLWDSVELSWQSYYLLLSKVHVYYFLLTFLVVHACFYS